MQKNLDPGWRNLTLKKNYATHEKNISTLHKMISTHELKVLTREKNKLHHKTDEGKRPRDLVGSLETSEA